MNQERAERIANAVIDRLPTLAVMLEPRAVKLHHGPNGWVMLVDVAPGEKLLVDEMTWHGPLDDGQYQLCTSTFLKKGLVDTPTEADVVDHIVQRVGGEAP